MIKKKLRRHGMGKVYTVSKNNIRYVEALLWVSSVIDSEAGNKDSIIHFNITDAESGGIALYNYPVNCKVYYSHLQKDALKWAAYT